MIKYNKSKTVVEASSRSVAAIGAALISSVLMVSATASAGTYGSYQDGVYQGQPTYTAHEACKRSEDKRQLISGAIGAVAGGVIGSQVSANGARTEGSAIGAVLGGLAGAGLADQSIDCDPVYTGQLTYSQGGYPSGYSTTIGTSTTTSYPVSTQTYPATTSTSYYPDTVTYSNHPVYSDPNYGAGGLTYGTTTSTGTVSYPPSTSSGSYSTTYSNVPQTYVQTSYQNIPQTVSYGPVYTTSAPRYYSRTGYRAHPPRHRSRRRGYSQRGSHYHGQFVCTDRH